MKVYITLHSFYAILQHIHYSIFILQHAYPSVHNDVDGKHTDVSLSN